MTTWYDYVQRVLRSRGITAADATRAMGSLNASMFSNWKNGTRPTPGMAVAFARGVGESPLVALVEAGLLTEREIGGKVAPPEEGLANYSTEALLSELGKRAGIDFR